MITQVPIRLSARKRGYFLITQQVLNAIGELPQTGLLNLFIQHTSCALTINENVDPSVRVDFESIFSHLVPENEPYYTHTFEGSDDMPAHIKSSLLGVSLTIPISNHTLNLGTWQGIYFCEFRNFGGQRNIIATIYA